MAGACVFTAAYKTGNRRERTFSDGQDFRNAVILCRAGKPIAAAFAARAYDEACGGELRHRSFKVFNGFLLPRLPNILTTPFAARQYR